MQIPVCVRFSVSARSKRLSLEDPAPVVNNPHPAVQPVRETIAFSRLGILLVVKYKTMYYALTVLNLKNRSFIPTQLLTRDDPIARAGSHTFPSPALFGNLLPSPNSYKHDNHLVMITIIDIPKFKALTRLEHSHVEHPLPANHRPRPRSLRAEAQYLVILMIKGPHGTGHSSKRLCPKAK